MKITIELDEKLSCGLSPHFVYRSLYTEYWNKLRKEHQKDLWGLATACDTAARSLYAENMGRNVNVKNLILTYSDAEACFNLFKQFADVWAKNYEGR